MVTAWRWQAWGLGLALVGLLSACGLDGTVVGPRATATPTVTVTPSTTPTATPTATPAPTATPTATPLPPVAVALSVEPEQPRQGQTLVIRVTLDRAAALNGDWDGYPLTFFYPSPLEAWALAPVAPWSALGPRPLALEARAPEGATSESRLSVSVAETPFEVQAIEVPPEQDTLLLDGLRESEDRFLAAVLADVSPTPLWDGPFGIPAEGYRTSPFGARRSYQGGPLTGYHGGLDFGAPEGTGIFAPAAGIVVLAEPLAVRGNVIVLDHGLGTHTLYFHLATMEVAPSQPVARGDFLGTIGTTGLSTGPHLHWEVRLGEIFVDPDEWLAQHFGAPED